MKIRQDTAEHLRASLPEPATEGEGLAGASAPLEPAGELRDAEAALVELARQNPHAFGELYELHVDRIYAYIYHRVGNAHDAEDLTARTFHRALDRLDLYEDRGLPFSAWLFRIAHNLVANWHRDRQRRRLLSLDRLWGHSRDEESPESQVERQARQAALLTAIQRLPEERQNLLILKFGGQLTNIEIGALLEKSESAIKSLYFRTLASLRKDLEARGWGEEVPSADDVRGEDGDTDGGAGGEEVGYAIAKDSEGAGR